MTRRAAYAIGFVWAACVVGGGLAHPSLAQTAGLSPADSLRFLNEARQAQRAFETFRHARLPLYQAALERACDAQIGRMCYWHSQDDTLIPEPSAITRARMQLITVLDRLNERSRGDPWIAGQRVFYMVEGGFDSSAVVASRECWAAAWWCAVLRGYALHTARRYAAAEVVFDSALALMPAAERCKWNDISLLLLPEERETYAKLPCDQRANFERHFWQLADPSYLIPGNDRRTEHFSRVLIAELMATSQNPYGIPWGDDLRELLIRYGTPSTYSRSWPRTSLGGPVSESLVGHEREPSYQFAAIDVSSDTIRWALEAPQARERYSPPYLKGMTPIDAQFAMFKRGDSAIVVSIYADTVAGRNDAVLGMLDSAGLRATQDSTSGARIRIGRTAWRGVVVGMEQIDPKTERMGRVRAWLAPPRADVTSGAPELSTMLLYAGDDTSAVATLDEAVHRALTRDELRGSRKLGIYWEMYDTAGSDSLANVSLAVTRINVGFLSRFAQALHMSPKDSPLIVAWHDVPSADGVSHRSVVMDLGQLPAGEYRVTLTVGPDDTKQTVTSRVIRIAE